jgi:repressor LexA
MQGLTKRQEQTLDFIRSSIQDRGYPPTLREIGEFMGIKSTNGVNDHLRALERKGYLRREDMKSRALKLVEDPKHKSNGSGNDDTIEIQVVGRVAAGAPLLADETHRHGAHRQDDGCGERSFRAESQRRFDDRCRDPSGDYIFVKRQATAERGDIVVALIGDEATVKYYYPERDYVRFQPANAQMAPILVRATDFKSTMLLGKVVGVYRRL